MSWSREQAAQYVRVPSEFDDKYSRGVLGVVTGSVTYPGAAVLTVEAAINTGVGMVRYLGDAADYVLTCRPEAVTADGRVQAWLLGSGMPKMNPTEIVFARALASGVPLVLDAGALDPLVLNELLSAPKILTPHAGEAASLLGRSREAVEQNPTAAAREIAKEWNATVVLKGNTTSVVNVADTVMVGPNSPWLATAGTGDVLAGILGALMASQPGANLVELAAAAVWIHAEAARQCGGPFGASDLAGAVRTVVQGLVS